MFNLRSCCLIGGLCIFFASNVMAQEPVKTLDRYWKDSINQRSRLAFGRLQTQDKIVPDDVSIQVDDQAEASGKRRIMDEIGQKPFVWPRRTIKEIVINPVNNVDKKPEDRSHLLTEKFSRDWIAFETIYKNYRWEAPCISYQPLYFEDIALERYGHSWPGLRQGLMSYAHFFSSAALLPFHMHKDPPFSCDYPLGYCRPGNCAPTTWQRHIWR